MKNPVAYDAVLLLSIAACTSSGAGADASPTDGASGTDATNGCVFTSPSGPGVGGLTVEGCTFEGGAAGIAAPEDLHAVAVEPGGNTIYLLYGAAGHRTLARFVDDTGAGCHLHRDTTWIAPTLGSEDALYADVALDSSVYVASPTLVAWSGGRTGMCPHTDSGLGTRASLQIGPDLRIVAPSDTGPARLLDTSSCAYSDAAFGPRPARGAARVGSDFVFVTSTNVQRFDATGAMRWNGTGSISSGGEIRPCGGDVCVMEPGASALARFSGIDGARVATYAWSALFGSTFGPAARIDACPGGSTIAVAWGVAQSQSCASPEGGAYAVAVVRVRGF